MDSSSEKFSPFDLMAAILKGANFDGSNSSESGGAVSPAIMAMLIENKELVMILTTSVAVLIGCVAVLVWRRASGSSKKVVEPPKSLMPKVVVDPEELDDGKKKVAIFFGTQTGTAEGFAKVRFWGKKKQKQKQMIDIIIKQTRINLHKKSKFLKWKNAYLISCLFLSFCKLEW